MLSSLLCAIQIFICVYLIYPWIPFVPFYLHLFITFRICHAFGHLNVSLNASLCMRSALSLAPLCASNWMFSFCMIFIFITLLLRKGTETWNVCTSGVCSYSRCLWYRMTLHEAYIFSCVQHWIELNKNISSDRKYRENSILHTLWARRTYDHKSFFPIYPAASNVLYIATNTHWMRWEWGSERLLLSHHC